MDEKTTYTKDELAEFRQLILDKIESAQDDLDVLRAGLLMILTMAQKIPHLLLSNLKKDHLRFQKKKISN